MFANLRAFYQRHASFCAIFALFVVFRLLAIVLLRPGGLIADASDYDFYYEWGLQLPRGYQTFVDLWTAYPPFFPALMLPIFEWSSRIPPWVEPRLFFHLLFGLELLLFESANLLLIYRLALKLGYGTLGTGYELRVTSYELQDTPPATRHPPHASPLTPSLLHPVILYALLFVPVYTMLGWFEAMPLFFMLWGLDLLLSSRWGWIGSAVAAALGFLIKLTPAILVPLAIRWLGSKLSWRAIREEWLRRRAAGNLLRPTLYTALFLLIVVGLGYPLARGNVALALSSLRVNSIRPPWQSLWALLDGYYGYGLVPLDMRNLVGLQHTLWESRLPWGVITLGFGLLYLWLYTRRYDWSTPRTPIAFAGVSVIWLFLYSKGWSPQFLVWILAFLVLLQPTWRGIMVGVGLSMINVAESHLYLIMLPTAHWLMTATVLLRTVLLLLVAGEWLGQIWPAPGHAHQLRRISAVLTWSLLLGAGVSTLAALPTVAEAYQSRRLAEHPCREAIAELQAEATWPAPTLVSDQIEIWRDFSPWLHTRYDLHIVDGYDATDRPWDEVVAERLTAYVQAREFWWITYREKPTHAALFFAQPEVKLISERTLGACQVARVKRITGTPLARVAVAGGPILLHAVAVGNGKVGEALPVVLYWEGATPVTESYTVFTHLLDANGQMVAQQDNLPVAGLAPTQTWQPQRLIRDPYRLSLPATVVPGAYRVEVGLYTTAGRQSMTLADGTTADHIVLPITIAP